MSVIERNKSNPAPEAEPATDVGETEIEDTEPALDPDFNVLLDDGDNGNVPDAEINDDAD